MPQYLIAIYLPNDFQPSVPDKEAERDINALEKEVEAAEAAGVVVFRSGLRPASDAKSLRAQADGKVLVTDGPYLETKEHIGGFSVVEAANLDEALAWARKTAVVFRVPVEVRQVWRPGDN